MPINNSDVKLMLAIIGNMEGLKTDNDKLAAIIGGGVSANAIRQRVQKIKNLAKAYVAGNGSDEDMKFTAASTPTTTPKRSSFSKASAPANTSWDDSEETASPSRKRAANGKSKAMPKGRAAKGKAAMKEETDADGDLDAMRTSGGVSDEESPAKHVKMDNDVDVKAEGATET